MQQETAAAGRRSPKQRSWTPGGSERKRAASCRNAAPGSRVALPPNLATFSVSSLSLPGALWDRNQLRHCDRVRPRIVVVAAVADAEMELAGIREARVQDE